LRGLSLTSRLSSFPFASSPFRNRADRNIRTKSCGKQLSFGAVGSDRPRSPQSLPKNQRQRRVLATCTVH
jgi:hypothetical protein